MWPTATKATAKKPTKNFFQRRGYRETGRDFFAESFEYQLRWHRAGLEHRIRDILKSRQIGATFYFSREALLHALKTGHNQIFLSASKTQAYVFREYIIQFARRVDVDLTGDPIVIGNNGAKLIFLGTNSNTAQSHNGDLYVDEIFLDPQLPETTQSVVGHGLTKPPAQHLLFDTFHPGTRRLPVLVGGIIQPGPRQRQRAG